jgi:hypothetical protein
MNLLENFKSFPSDFTLNEGITIFISLIAIVFTASTYFITKRNDLRQIRIAKLEEILGILFDISSHYYDLEDIFIIQSNLREAYSSNLQTNIDKLQEEEQSEILRFKEQYASFVYNDKLPKLIILSNSYLPTKKKLRYKTILVAQMMARMYNATILKAYDIDHTFFSEYPDFGDFIDYVEKLEFEIIKEKKMGYPITNSEDLNKYREIFKRDLKIK